MSQAEKYFNAFYEYFDLIYKSQYSFEFIDFRKTGYRSYAYSFDSVYLRIQDYVLEIISIIGSPRLGWYLKTVTSSGYKQLLILDYFWKSSWIFSLVCTYKNKYYAKLILIKENVSYSYKIKLNWS